ILLVLLVISDIVQCAQTSSQLDGVDKTFNRQRRQLQDEKKYDQCSHPFHSFLCNPAPKPRTSIPQGAASFNVKQILKPSPPVVAAPSFDVKTIASPDSASNFLRILTTPPPTERKIEDTSPVNCEQHNKYVKAPLTPKPTTSTPKPVAIIGESSFSRESRLPPQPYLPPIDSPSPAPTFLDPQKIAPPLTSDPPKVKTSILEGQAANAPQSIVPNDNEVDNCKHAFHSFLCSSPSRSRNRPTLTPNVPLTGESTFLDPQNVLLPSPQNKLIVTPRTSISSTRPTTTRPTTTRPIKTSKTPPRILAEAAQTPIAVLAPQTENSQEPYYFCNTSSTTVKPITSIPRTYSPFQFKSDPNSFRSSTLPPTTSRKTFTFASTTTKIKPFTFTPFSTTPSPIRGDSSFIDPVRFPFPSSTTQKPTVRTPDPPVRNIAAAQTPDVTVVKPDHEHNHDHDHGHDHHHGIDILPSKRKRPTGELPARFKNPVPPNLTGASSFNNPTKVLPEVNKPPSNNNNNIKNNHIEQVQQLPPPCDHPSHQSSSSLPQTSLRGGSTFQNPSKVLPPLSAQSSENRDIVKGYDYPKPSTSIPITTRNPGYVYNKPDNQLQYPKYSLFSASTNDQPSKIDPPFKFSAQNSDNKPGYTYEKPAIPLQLPSTTTKPNDNIFGQDNNNKGNSQGYNYPKPPPNRQFPTPRPVNNIRSGNVPPEFNRNAGKTPFSSSIFGSKTSPESVLPIGQSANNREVSQDYSYPKPVTSTQLAGQDLFATKKPDSFQGYNYRKSENEFQSPSNDRTPTIIVPAIQPRPFSKPTVESPPCDHTSHQVTRSAKIPSPSEFVRGPTGAAGLLAASNDLPDKCNHPFLGYICKRSSDKPIPQH
ncbi:hypothetical protein L9F63_027639, partial [Diploptera punctata]